MSGFAGDSLADCYAAHLLHSLGIPTDSRDGGRDRSSDDLDAARDWAASGLMWLTGDPAGPPARSAHAVPSCASGALRALRAVCGDAPALPTDGAALLTERSAMLGFSRRGGVSANGTCHLLATADGLLAVNLARQSDWEVLPAWLEIERTVSDPADLAALLRGRRGEQLLARGQLLGLAVAREPRAAKPPRWYDFAPTGDRVPRREGGEPPLVVDLSSLWAGPLCSHLLHLAGARVVRVASSRPDDGARVASTAFFDLLDKGKTCAAVDFNDARGRGQLRRLLRQADIVIEGSRPRALRQLGIDADAVLAARPGRLWVSLTGHGRAGESGNRVAFGDDAAVAAGLLHRSRDGTAGFCGDAICDPLTGLHAALAATSLWRRGRGGLLSLNLRDVGAHCRSFYTCGETGVVVPADAPGQWALQLHDQRFAVRRPCPGRARVRCAAEDTGDLVAEPRTL
ncbi:MAG: CoA transferase [Halioglobus sp.]|nr:CoA transferase [Halioglobus sp.]